MRSLILAAATGLLASAGFADCPARSPNMSWNVFSGDQKVSATFLEKTLKGKRVRYNVGGQKGTEHYGADGSYKYVLDSETFQARGAVFYKNGVRCIDYPNSPRFDRYVVSGKKLVLINRSGGRFEGAVLK